jgi:hypothetical protein
MRATISDAGMTLASTERKSSNRPKALFLCLHFQPEEQLSHQSLPRAHNPTDHASACTRSAAEKDRGSPNPHQRPFSDYGVPSDDGSMVRPIPAGRLPVDPDFTSEGLLR